MLFADGSWYKGWVATEVTEIPIKKSSKTPRSSSSAAKAGGERDDGGGMLLEVDILFEDGALEERVPLLVPDPADPTGGLLTANPEIMSLEGDAEEVTKDIMYGMIDTLTGMHNDDVDSPEEAGSGFLYSSSSSPSKGRAQQVHAQAAAAAAAAAAATAKKQQKAGGEEKARARLTIGKNKNTGAVTLPSSGRRTARTKGKRRGSTMLADGSFALPSTGSSASVKQSRTSASKAARLAHTEMGEPEVGHLYLDFQLSLHLLNSFD